MNENALLNENALSNDTVRLDENALLYEYAVLRYVPSVEREEFINVGLLMMCKRRRWLRCAFTLDRARLAVFDARADLDALERQLAMFGPESTAMSGNPVEERFRWLTAVKSCVIQTSRPHPGLIPCRESPSAESAARLLDATFDRLYTDLVL